MLLCGISREEQRYLELLEDGGSSDCEFGAFGSDAILVVVFFCLEEGTDPNSSHYGLFFSHEKQLYTEYPSKIKPKSQ